MDYPRLISQYFSANSCRFWWPASFFLLLAILVILAPVALASSPSSYVAIQDLAPHAAPPPPTLGPAGTNVTDPVFFTRIARVTDANTLGAAYVNRSFMTPSSAEQNTWNTNSTRFYVQFDGGWLIPYGFDPTTLSSWRLPDPTSSYGGLVLTNINGATFSFNKPTVLYGAVGSGLGQYDFSTNQYSLLLDLSMVASTSGHIGDVSTSVNEQLATYFGGASQDDDNYVIVYDQHSLTYHVLDTMSSTIDGAPLPAPLGWKLHNARLEKSGRFVIMTPVNVSSIEVWDTQTNAVYAITNRPEGHHAAAYGAYLNQDTLPGDYGPNWLGRPLSSTGPGDPAALLPANAPPYWSDDSHLSWNNANLDGSAPVLISTYHSQASAAGGLLDGEIFALSAAGNATSVWHFAHHNSIYNGNFWDSPRGNVSQDGLFFMFTSNWGNSVGTDPYGQNRDDAFIVELAMKSGGPPTALSSVTLAASAATGGQAISGTAYLAAASASPTPLVFTSSNPNAAQVGAVTIPAGATSAAFTVQTSPVSAATPIQITVTAGTSSRLASLTVLPPDLSYFTLYPTSVSGGQTTTYNYVYLTGASGPGGTTVTVTSSNPAVATVTSFAVAAGATSGSFAIKTSSVSVPTPVQVSVTAGAVTQSATLTVTPPDLYYFTLYPASISGGQSSTYNYVYLTAPAAANGTVVALKSSNPLIAAVPRSITVPAGATFAVFSIRTTAVSAPTSIQISANAGNVTQSLNLLVKPPDLYYFTLYPATITGGQTSTYNYVYLTATAARGVAVTVSSSNPAVARVANFTIPAGLHTGSFAIYTSAVTSPTPVQITVTAGSVSETLTVTVVPGG
ncbi:MAG TPA: hypothetical protein VLY24_21410 [Bryobacteraceae bacterium]|nr:hypothetical protein [Bryobacteraceae bacterium]